MRTNTRQDCVVLLVSLLSTVTAGALTNVAPSGTATQSSLHGHGVASKAIDGNKDPYYYNGSCTHTAWQADPWWLLTLPAVYSVAAVSVTNRVGSAGRLDNAVILIGNSPDNNGNNNPKCADIPTIPAGQQGRGFSVPPKNYPDNIKSQDNLKIIEKKSSWCADIPSIPAGQTSTFQCGGMEGLFVTISIPGPPQWLSLCEVEVFVDVSPNVAPSGTATQSSLYGNNVAPRAIDGNKDPDFDQGFCSCTDFQADPWWRLTLPAVYRITAVRVSNRVGSAGRLDNAVILIGNSPDNDGNNNPKCADIPSIPAGQTNTFQCGGMEGRFVNIYLPGPYKMLTLCEVEVVGEPVVPFLSGTVMGRSVAVVQKKLCWSDALFFCRNTFWDLLSVRSPEEQLELQNLLSNASFPLTKHLWLGLRRYLRGDKWFWMSGEAMTYNVLQSASVWQAASPCAGMESASPYRWTDYPCDQHAYFVCLKDPQEGVDKVEFFSTRNAAKNP